MDTNNSTALSLPTIAIMAVVFVLGLIGFAFLIYTTTPAPVVASPTPTPTMTPSPTPAANTRIYLSKNRQVSFVYDASYQVVRETPTQVAFSTQQGSSTPFEELTVSNTMTFPLKKLQHCSQMKTVSFPCIGDGKGWGQEEDIAPVTVGGVPAISFYIGGAPDNAYHVVQTTANPKMEWKMYVAGGGLDARFSHLLQTISFHPQETWNTYTDARLGFRVSYPVRLKQPDGLWQQEELADSVSFGPLSSKSGGYLWRVSVLPLAGKEDQIQKTGKQFPDRHEVREDVTINGVVAQLVTVTTGKDARWKEQSVYLPSGTNTYVISNGAVPLPEFSKFYQSLELLH